MQNNLIFLAHVVVAGTLLVLAARAGRLWVVALIAVCTVMMNIEVAKQMTLLGLNVTGGNVLFATVFLANDVINEHYGRQAAREAVLIGFSAGLAVLALMQFALWYAPNAFDDSQPHLAYFFNVSMYPRIVAASMVSYLLAQMLDVWLYDAIRRRTGTARLLWLRSNGSTWVSQAFDTVFFTTAGLTGGAVIRSWPEWRDAVIFAYLVKILLAAADTPFLYLTRVSWLRPRDSHSIYFTAEAR